MTESLFSPNTLPKKERRKFEEKKIQKDTFSRHPHQKTRRKKPLEAKHKKREKLKKNSSKISSTDKMCSNFQVSSSFFGTR
jgi:hypothetical protein